jgi:hypothetical protein
LTSSLSKAHFDIILPPMPMSPTRCHPLRCLDQHFIYILSFSHLCSVSVKLLILQFVPASCCILLGPNVFLRHPPVQQRRLKLQINQEYESVSKSFRTGHLERELQMVQLSVIRYSYITIL